jgi:thioesterase domain-containing protein
MVPSSVVLLDEMPLTPNGKIDRRALPAPQSLESRVRDLHPRDEIELQLLHIWEGILGLEQVGMTDNFFQLGGNSLQALRLVAQVKKQLGQTILLSTLIDHGTIRGMAQLLGANRPATAGHLVPLQPRGDGPPLYLIHPGHGNVVCYLDLIRYLGPGQPFYGFQSLELEHDGGPSLSVEEMAARYVRILRETCPRPPGGYLLGGWSFGGLIAYEMARQLWQQGDDVLRVFLLDSRVPAIREALAQLAPELLQASLLVEEAQSIVLGAGQEPLALTPRDLVDLGMEEQLDLLLRELAQRGVLPADMERQMIRRYFNVRRARREAMHRYVPQPYDGRIVLFRATELNPETPLEEVREIHRDALQQSPTYGWSELSRQVEVEPVPGHHESMIRDPHVRALAAALRPHLEAVKEELSEGACPVCPEGGLIAESSTHERIV